MPIARDELVVLRRDYLKRQLEALAARVRMLEGAKLTFDEESQALYDAVAPTHPDSYFEAALKEIDQALPGEGPLVDRYEAFRAEVHRPRRPARRACSTARSPNAAARTLPHVQLPANETFTVEYVHGQAVERLQLVSGQLPQPDPGEHRSADLHRPRDRPRLPRGLSRASRLQRAAREAPRARSRLGRVLGLRAVLAAVADRRGHRELRHRGGVSRASERLAFERDVLFPLAGLDGSQAAPTRRCARSSIASPTRATRRRANTSTARWTRTQTVEWLTRYAMMPRRDGRAAHPLLRHLSQLRHQLQPRQGPREAVRRVARRRRLAARRALAGVRPPARLAPPALRPARDGRR